MLILALALIASPLPCRAEARPAAPLPAPSDRAWQTGLLRSDRLQHASLGFTAGLAIGIATRQPWAAFTGVGVLALGKEIADRRTGGFDPLDLSASLIGAGAAGLVTVSWKP